MASTLTVLRGLVLRQIASSHLRRATFLAAILVTEILLAPGVGSSSADLSADQLMERGQSAYQQGSFAHATQYWSAAAQRFEEEGRAREQIKAQVSLAQALYQTGRYKEAGSILSAAGTLAERIEDRLLVATVKGRLGTVLFALGDNELALRMTEDGLSLARDAHHAALTATLLNDQGNILSAEGQHSAAANAYAESSVLAKASKQTALATIALINAARANIQEGATEPGQAQLHEAAQQLVSAPATHETATAWLTLGDAYEDILRPRVDEASAKQDVQRPLIFAKRGRGATIAEEQAASAESTEPVPESESLPPADLSDTDSLSVRQPASITHPILREAAVAYWNAIQTAAAVGDIRDESYGWGHLGHVYEMLDRPDEALALTRRALLTAQQIQFPEALYRWHWQTARLLRIKGRTDDAILAYQRAIDTLQPIRSEFLTGSRNRQFSFRETTGNLFFELSDLLLQRAAAVPDSPARQQLLIQAQDTVELYKAAELQDYFRDECVATARSRSTEVAQESKTTAIIYPIILRDRLELLVSLPGGLKQFIVAIPSAQLTKEIRSFRLALERRTSNAYLVLAQKFYDWMIRPMEADLTSDGITTLVFVPDGPLRTIPMAPLHDGKHFLIERYALATTPGLTLTDSRPLDRKNVHMFSVGLTQAVQGFPPLPYVAQELRAVRSIYGGKQLMNDEFRVVQVERGLKEEPYNIIHIASHGRVESDGNKSFILTFDDRITMDRLSDLVGLFDFRTAPLELLTLSACETAAGDDRAALGLAGMAVKAGAKSALATLWYIEDEATAALIAEFYRTLQNPAVTKADALRQAQLTLLKDPTRSHPSLWAPFLLINNWL